MGKAQSFTDNIVFDTVSQPATGSLGFGKYDMWAQRFTTDNSSDITLRRLEFDFVGGPVLDAPYNVNFLTVALTENASGFPAANWLASWDAVLIGGLHHYRFYGNIQLLPNTTYWVTFSLPQFLDWYSGGSIPTANTGQGLWFGPNDGVSAHWIDDAGWLSNNSPPIQLTISTVPEPASSCLLALGAFCVFRKRCFSPLAERH